MINPQLFNILKASIPVKLLFGSNPLRVYPSNEAPEEPRKPYAVYGVYSGTPENYLDRVPDMDRKATQVDIYADTMTSCENCFTAIRNAVEPEAHMVGFSTPTLDPDTKLYRAMLDFHFLEAR